MRCQGSEGRAQRACPLQCVSRPRRFWQAKWDRVGDQSSQRPRLHVILKDSSPCSDAPRVELSLCFAHKFSLLRAGEMLRFLRFPVIANTSLLLGSDFRFSLRVPGVEPAPNTYRGSCSERCRHSVSQKLIGSLARPIKVELALRPVSSGLERGAELFGGALIGAPRMWEGRWVSNQTLRMPGMFHEAIA